MTARRRGWREKVAVGVYRAHTVAWRVFDLDQLWDAINERDGQMPNTAWIAALLDVKRHGERATRWFIRKPWPWLRAPKKSPSESAAAGTPPHSTSSTSD